MVIFTVLLRIFAAVALAQLADADMKLSVNVGSNSTLMDIFTGLNNLLVKGIVSVTAAVVTAGGIIVAASHGKESWVENGKKVIMGGLIGFIIVMGSFGIYKMIESFVYDAVQGTPV